MLQHFLLPVLACVVSLFALIYWGVWFTKRTEKWLDKWFDKKDVSV